jgi:hypothetical protein
MEFAGDWGLDQGPRIAPVRPDGSVEKDKTELRISSMEAFDSADHVVNSLAPPVDPAVAQNVEPVFGERVREGMKNTGINRPRSAGAFDSVFPFDTPADPLRVAEEAVLSPDDFSFQLMPLHDEIKIFFAGSQFFESGKNRIFTAQADVELILFQGIERPGLPQEGKPVRRSAPRMKESIGVAAADERVSELDVAPDAAKDLDVGKQGRDVHVVTKIRPHSIISASLLFDKAEREKYTIFPFRLCPVYHVAR